MLLRRYHKQPEPVEEPEPVEATPAPKRAKKG